jgi:AcrR family transcriptional regulator
MVAKERASSPVRGQAEGAAAVGPRPDTNGLPHSGMSGRAHPVGQQQVANFQRARMLSAMVAEISERGVANVSVAHVVARSGVSRRTFYEIFADREACFLAAFDDALQGASAVVTQAFEQPGSWRSRIRAGLIALLEALEGDRVRGRLLIAESLAAGPRALERRQNVFTQLIPIIDQGRAEVKGEGPPPLTAEGILGATLSIIHSRLLAHDPDPLVELTGALMAMIVLPYLGPAAARAEIARPVPKGVPRPARVSVDPMRGLRMRLTYRTLRVLIELGERPGASNRQIGEAAGIGDQGQVSKLLGRLSRLGLIENTHAGRDPGGSNAWQLTRTGRELEQSARERTGG